MDFAAQLERIKAAGTDPQALALVTLDIVLATHPPELRRAVEAAAIPHWFDAEILSALLDDDLRGDAMRWLEAVTALPAIERFPARAGFNVHEATRLALRRRLYTENPARFAQLSGRAASACEGASVALRIERMFHRLAHAPEDAGPELRELEFDLRANPEDGLTLCRTLWEYAEDESWHSLVRGWSLLMQAIVRWQYLPAQQALSLAERARDCFHGVSALGDGVASGWIGQLLHSRGQAGDAGRALEWFEKSLEIAERLCEANPQSAQAARDVSVSVWRLGNFHRERGQAGDAGRALEWFEKSLGIAERLYEANPQSARAARDVSVSHYGMFRCYQGLAKPEEANRHRAACFAILDSFARAGRPMDPQMRELYEHLKPLFPENR